MYTSRQKELSKKLDEEQREYRQHWFSSSNKPSDERMKDYIFREMLAAQIRMADLTDKEVDYLLAKTEPLTSLFNSLRNHYDINITVDRLGDFS